MNNSYIEYLKKLSSFKNEEKLNHSDVGKVFRVLWGDGFVAMKVFNVDDPKIDVAKELSIMYKYNGEPGFPKLLDCIYIDKIKQVFVFMELLAMDLSG